MKFGQFILYSKRKNLIKKFYKNCGLKTKHNLYWEIKFLEEDTYICNSKAIKTSPNQHDDLLRFLFTEDSLKIT